MPNYEEALRNALTALHGDFERADTDLHQEVAAAARALQSITQGIVTLKLVKLDEGETGRRYKLVVSGRAVDADIEVFHVPPRGYPITVSGVALRCKDKQALAEYFSQLASNPDSKLVIQAAYIMRKKD
jgi:hypothetical protein